jgi:hypothetical protein
MSRGKIAIVVAVVVGGLTAAAYSLTTSKLENKIKDDVRGQVQRSRRLLLQNASFEALNLMDRATSFARTPSFAQALVGTEPKKMELDAGQGIREALANVKEGEPKPDFLAVLNKEGQLIAIDPSGPFPTDWKQRYPTVAASLDKKRSVKDVWEWEKQTMKVAVAPIVERNTNEVLGAVVAAYSLDADEAAKQSNLLEAQVAYFFDGKVRATSFGKSGSAEDETIAKLLFEGDGLAKGALESKEHLSELKEVTLNGVTYMAGAGALPLNLSDKTSGAVVMVSLSKALEPVAMVKTTILLVGLAGLVIAVLAIFLTARLILSPAEEIELGVTEIINGNTDYTFRPAGADFDGLANVLNVMLARLLGRPEPGEEEYDDQGNVIGGTGKVLLGDADPGSEKNQEALALANESEPDYYRRVFDEYMEARKKAGEKTDGVTLEGFSAKLRMNEANLKKKYNAKAVRFKVVIKDNQVTLKPVPIL